MKYRNWIAHGFIVLASAITVIYYIWLLPQILKDWQEMFACEECIRSTYDILPLLAPPLPIILLMAWWTSILLSREIQTPRKRLEYFTEPSNRENTKAATGSRPIIEATYDWHPHDKNPSPNRPFDESKQNPADSTTPATTNPTKLD